MAGEADTLDARTRLAEVLFNDPEARADIEKHTARIFPKAKASIPSLVIREEGQKTLAQINKVIDDDKRERLAEKQQRDLAAQRQAITDDPELRIRPDEIDAVEKLMVEETIGSHKAAARLYRAQQQVSSPRSDYTSAMQIPGVKGAGGEEFKGLVEDPDGWARQKAHQILADMRSGRGAN